MLETVHKNVLTLRSNHCSKDFLQRLSRLRDDNFFVDISLKVEDTLIPAHRVGTCERGKPLFVSK